MGNNVLTNELEEFQSLLRFGIRWITMNIENGQLAIGDLSSHLSQMNDEECKGSVEVDNCFEACKYWLEQHGQLEMNCNIDRSLDISKRYIKGCEGVIPLEVVDCKIPDGWIIVIFTDFNKQPSTIYKIFSNWQFTDVWDMSSGATDFSAVQEYKDYFIWKQSPGDSYKLFKNRGGHFTKNAQKTLESKFIDPAEKSGNPLQFMTWNELQYVMSED